MTAGVALGGDLLAGAASVLVLAAVAGVLGAATGLVHRWYAAQRVPPGLAVIVALSVVAVYLNTAGALGDVMGGGLGVLEPDAAVYNVVTFGVAAATATVGSRLGDRTAVALFAGSRPVDREVGRLVRSVGRQTTVELPESIDDVAGFDPVEPATRDALAGRTFAFPRGLTVEELRTRVIERLRTDYGVGHVDIDLADDGTVEYLALGSREAGLGPTLPPGSAAVAIRADPPNNARPGDAVQLWRTEPSGDAPTRVATAELRGTAGDVVTVATDAETAEALDPASPYRIVTVPAESRADRVFAARLRAAEETMGVVEIDADSSLANATVGSLDVAIVAVRTTDGEVEAIPGRSRPLVPGETVYAIARPDRLRRLEEAATTVRAEGSI